METRALLLGLTLALHDARAEPRDASERVIQTSAIDDERARTAFARLSAEKKREVLDFFELETSHSSSFQAFLVAWAQKQQDRDARSWRVRADPPVFDPAVHAPAQVIPRHALPSDSAQARRVTVMILGRVPIRRLRPGFVYDYATREIERIPCDDDASRELDNALAGFPRHLDLAEAQVERMLDDGSQHKAAIAFAHAYTDRAGAVYPAITLYDAHASGAEIEMPDVDTLGIVHTLLGDSDTWRAPVPTARQEALYDKLGELFLPLHHHRGLRHALACTFMAGSEVLRDGYQGNVTNFHALWESCESTPGVLRAQLPAPENWSAYLEAWTKRCFEEKGIFAAGKQRQAVLDQNASEVRATLFRVLEEYGALARSTNTKTPHERGEAPR